MNNNIERETENVLQDQISTTLATWPTYIQGLDPATEMAARGKLANKLSQAYNAIERVLHDDKNTEHKYSYASAETIYKACRAGMSSVGLAVVPLMGDYMDVPILKKDNSGERRGAYLVVEFTFCLIDAETGYTVVIPWRGEVMEYGDKAFNKAATNATKYMLRTLFLLPTDREEDADRHSPIDRPSTRSRAVQDRNDIQDQNVDSKGHRGKFSLEFMAKTGLDKDRPGLQKFKETANRFGLDAIEMFYKFASVRQELKTWNDFQGLLEQYVQAANEMEGKAPSESSPPTKSEPSVPEAEVTPKDYRKKSKPVEKAEETPKSQEESATVLPAVDNSSEAYFQACDRLNKAVTISPDKLLITRRVQKMEMTVMELIRETIAFFPKGGMLQLYTTLERLEKSWNSSEDN